MIGEIPPVHWPNVQKVLPAVYGDELSYYELLAKMEKVVNDLIEQANAVGVEVNQFEEALKNIDNLDEIDAKIQAMQELVNSLQGELEEVQETLDELPSYEEFVDISEIANDNAVNKVPFPVMPNSKYGTDGQVLRTNGDGSTQWQNPILPTDEQAEEYIGDWLNAHPEATTTVLDDSITTQKMVNGAITLPKLNDDVLDTFDAVRKLIMNSDTFITKPRLNVGKYYTVDGSSLILVDNDDSVYTDKINVSSFRNAKIKITLSSHSSISTRRFGLCNSVNTVSVSYTEASAPFVVEDGKYVLEIPITDDFFFFSCTSGVEYILIYVDDLTFFSKGETLSLIDNVYDDLGDTNKNVSILNKVTGLDENSTFEPEITNVATSNRTRAFTNKIDVLSAYKTFAMTFSGSDYQYAVYTYNSADVQIGTLGDGFYSTSATFGNTYNFAKVAIGFKKSDNTAFTSTDIANIKEHFNNGTWQLTIGIDKLVKTPCYVSPNGSDTNNGLRRDSAFATIQKALTEGFKKIIVRAGVYTTPINMTGEVGVSIELDRNYGNYASGTEEDNPKIVIDGNNALNRGVTISGCYDCEFDSIEVRNCNTNGWNISRSSGLTLNDCVANNIAVGKSSGGGFVITYTDATFINCGVWNIGTATPSTSAAHLIDGFNIHGSGNTNFINCFAYNCLDDGISHHDACYGYIDGGEWRGCGKGGIASPTHGAHVDIRNAYCHDNAYGIYAYADNGAVVNPRLPINISGCVCKDNRTYDIGIGNYYTANVWNSIYSTYEGFTPLT